MPRDYDAEIASYQARCDYEDDIRADAADEEAAREREDFERFCDEFGDDPDNPDSWDAYKDAVEYNKDPYKYYGVRRSDFL